MSDPNRFTPPDAIGAARRDKQMSRKNKSKRMIWVSWFQTGRQYISYPAALEDPAVSDRR